MIKNINNIGELVCPIIYPKKLVKRLYRIKVEFSLNEIQINYDISMEGGRLYNDLSEIIFDKNNYFINNKTSDKIIDEIAIQSSKAIYPLKLKFGLRNNYIKISNLEEINNRWIDVKKNINKDYEGQIYESYIKNFEYNLLNENVFMESLKKDLFLTLYTHSIYGDYTNNFAVKNNIHIKIGNLSLIFKGEQILEKHYNDFGDVFIYYKGSARNKTIYKGEEHVDIYELNVEYNLQQKSFTIKSIISSIEKIERNKSTLITKIEAYQLSEYDIDIDYDKQELYDKQKIIENDINYDEYLKRKERSWVKRFLNI